MRCLASATYIVRQICNLGITVYTPSVALSTVIGIPYYASIVGMAIICIFFTILVCRVGGNASDLTMKIFKFRSSSSFFLFELIRAA